MLRRQDILWFNDKLYCRKLHQCTDTINFTIIVLIKYHPQASFSAKNGNRYICSRQTDISIGLQLQYKEPMLWAGPYCVKDANPSCKNISSHWVNLIRHQVGTAGRSNQRNDEKQREENNPQSGQPAVRLTVITGTMIGKGVTLCGKVAGS